MRLEEFKENFTYLVEGVGARDLDIFLDEEDFVRFIFLLTHFQSPIQIHNVNWYVASFIKKGVFSTGEERRSEMMQDRQIELISFSIVPQKFMVILKNLEPFILSVYMHRVLTSYSKYFNSKYKKTGRVFGGPFKSTSLNHKGSLIQTSAELHKLPKHLKDWETNYENYPWSSYQDFVGVNRWEGFLNTDDILRHFKSQTDYKNFVSK